jgi:5-formyltetrahydrofolate cyclo-ligase
MSVLERKEILRKESRIRLRNRAGSVDIAEIGSRVQEHFLREFPPRPGGNAALYNAIPGEVPTERIRRAYLGGGVHLYYPRVMGERRLAFCPHGEGDRWEAGSYGILEPPIPPGTWAGPSGWDLIVVPGLAFDRGGNRLGHGFGYYDRFLEVLPERVLRVGLAFTGQLVSEVPVDEWDIPVHALVTEEGVIRVWNAPGSSES